MSNIQDVISPISLLTYYSKLPKSLVIRLLVWSMVALDATFLWIGCTATSPLKFSYILKYSLWLLEIHFFIRIFLFFNQNAKLYNNIYIYEQFFFFFKYT